MKSLADGTPIAWQPLPKQQLAFQCPARELLYGGEKGAAKTEFLVACWIALLNLAHQKYLATGQLQKKARIIIFRKNLEHLKDAIAKSFYLYPMIDPAMGTRGFSVNDKMWSFSSGATIAFRHLDGPTDHLGYHGNELIGIGFDQVEQISDEVYTFIVANLRSGDPDYHRERIVRCTANPGGYDWIIQYFGIDKHPQGGKIIEHKVVNRDGSEHSATRAFIRARLRDNPHLPADYEAHLRSIYTADQVAMFLEGDFFRVAGSYFSKFLQPGEHFQRSKPIPSSWEYRFAMDWGSTNPAAWLLGARDNDGRLWIIDELHQPGVTGSKFGETLAKRFRTQTWCREKVFAVDDFWGVIDKQAMDKYGSDASAADGIKEWGFRLFEAQKDRKSGCNAMKERLLMDRAGQPQLIIFEDRCPNLCRALSSIKSQAPKDPDDYDDSSPHSHIVDALRFLVMEFPVRTTEQVHPQDASVRQWERYIKRAQQQQAVRRGGDDDGDYAA